MMITDRENNLGPFRAYNHGNDEPPVRYSVFDVVILAATCLVFLTVLHSFPFGDTKLPFLHRN